jgi:carbonic anhydrase/acetyltransferase-like protein (isoleucine patch superfamily)
MLGAGSLVPPGKILASGFLYAGSPAKQRRKLTETELTLLAYMADNYVNLKDTYLEAEA